MMMFDLHTHHQRCGHATHEIEDYIQAAIGSGLQAIGISDHSPYFADSDDHPKPHLAMAKQEFPRYIDEIVAMKRKYEGEIEVLVGVESDFFPESVQLYDRIYRTYPFDYVIGSVHISNGKHLSDKKSWHALREDELEAERNIYFGLLQQAARSGAFDIIGHADLIKRYYGHFMKTCGPAVEQTLKVFAETGVVLEVNTSGINRGELRSPCDDVLERARHYGLKVTFASDAHQPGRVGEHWVSTIELLKRIGYKELILFRRRKPVTVAI